MKDSKKIYYGYLPIMILITLSIIEGILLLSGKIILGPITSSTVHFLASASIGILTIYFSNKKFKGDYNIRFNPAKSLINSRTKNIVTLISIMIFASIATVIIKQHAIDHKNVISTGSDVIPLVMNMNKRLLSGEFPYLPLPVPELSYTLIPNYLPLQWLPYLPAEILNFDYRFIPIILIIIALLMYVRKTNKIDMDNTIRLILIIFPLLFLTLYYIIKKGEVQRTLEVTMAAFYLLLSMAFLNREKIIFLSITILLCLLSRFSLVLWLPVAGIVLLHEFKFKQTFKIIGLVITGIILIYGPFLYQDPYIFFKGLEYYKNASLGVWEIQDWQGNDLYPYFIGNGLGLDVFIYKYGPTDLREKINLAEKLQLGVSLIFITVAIIIYLVRKTKVNADAFLLGTLKIYLTIFYAFIIMPYNYLYLVPFIINITILYMVAKNSNLLIQVTPPNNINPV